MANRQAWSYIRFSSPGQALGDSKRRQLELAIAYAKQHGLELHTEPYFDKGISAFKGKNAAEGALKKFLDEVDAGRIPAGSTLLVEALDRITRAEVLHALEIFLSIIRRGITIVTLKDQLVYSQEQVAKDNGMSLFGSLIALITAHQESKQKGDRVRASWEGRRQKSDGKIITGVCPPWLMPNGDRTAFVPIAEKTAIVQRIYKLALEGWGVQRMAKAFNAEKVPRLKNATEWRAQEFVRLLKWEATKGVLMSVDGTYRNEKYYPEIIKPKDWGRVQQAMKSRSDKETGAQGRPSAGVDNLFSRMLRCGVCGAGLRLTSRDRTNLRCLRAYAGGDCASPSYLYKPIEDEVLQLLLIDEHLDPLPQVGEPVDPSVDIRAELDEKNALLAKYMEQFETANAPRPITLRINKITDEITALEKQLREIATPVPVHDAWVRAVEVWTELQRTDEERVKADQEWAKQGAFDEYEEFDPERRKALRLKLQVGLRQLITRMNLLPRLYRSQPSAKFKLRPVRFYRKVEVIGPIVELLKHSEVREYEVTENGVLLDYTLPSYGSANYYREKEWQAQGDADIRALEKKHGIKSGLVEDAVLEEEKPKAKRKRPATVK